MRCVLLWQELQLPSALRFAGILLVPAASRTAINALDQSTLPRKFMKKLPSLPE